MEGKINHIFLIGNGFDLAHNLKTSYKDFIVWYLYQSVEQAIDNKIDRYEDDCLFTFVTPNRYTTPFRKQNILNELKDQIENCKLNIYDTGQSKFLGLMDRKTTLNHHEPLAFVPKNDFIKRILQYCFESDWSGIEDEIYKTIMTFHFQIQKNQKDKNTPIAKDTSVYPGILDKIKGLNKSVSCLKKNLVEYLKSQNQPDLFIDNLFTLATNFKYDLPVDMDLENPQNLSTNLFLNFNYTTYYKDIVSRLETQLGSPGHVFYALNIHGNLDSDADDIVFGIGDEQNDFYREVESMYDDHWLECMKSFHYFRNENYQDLLGFIKRDDYEIYVMGHSCSITDRTLLNMLFENENCRRIHVFHYKGMESYLRTAYNIARNFNDKVKLREVLMPFDPKLKMSNNNK